MSQLLEHFRTSSYKVPNSEPLAARKELVRAYSDMYKSHIIVPSYWHSPSSPLSLLKFEAVSREGMGYPLQQDLAIPELHIEFDSSDQAEQQELLGALPASRRKVR